MNIVWDDDAKARLKEIVLYGVKLAKRVRNQ